MKAGCGTSNQEDRDDHPWDLFSSDMLQNVLLVLKSP